VRGDASPAVALVGAREQGAGIGAEIDPGGLARYPIKAVILVALALLILQALAEAVRKVALLRGDGSERPAPEGSV